MGLDGSRQRGKDKGARLKSEAAATKATTDIRFVLPRHVKLVKALMRALDGREQLSLMRICRKLRQKNILKFVSELTHQDEDEMALSGASDGEG